MSKLIIWVGGRPAMHGHKRREFLWSEKHKCYLYGGAEIDEREFNERWAKAVKNHEDMRPQVKVVEYSAVAQPAPKPTPPVPAPVPPAPHVVTLDEAIAIVAREAPDRLRKLGPRPMAKPAPVMEVS